MSKKPKTEYFLDSNDVEVIPLEEEECEACVEEGIEGVRATHEVRLDLRCIGQSNRVGVYCEKCALFTRDQLREALPDPMPETE